MATVYSDQQSNANNLSAGTGYTLNNMASPTVGRVQVVVGTYTSTAVASGTVIEMFKLPKGARLIRGYVASGALGTSVTLSVGTDVALVKEDLSTALTAAGVANLLAATSHASATLTPFAATRLLGAGGITTAPTTVNVVTGGATLTAGIEVVCVAEYLVD